MQKLSQEANEARRVYMKKWRAANRDKTKEYRARYWERKAAEIGKETTEKGSAQ